MISKAQALDLLRSDDLIALGREADAVRKRLHPEQVVTYSLELGLTCTGKNSGQMIEAVEQAVNSGATGIVWGPQDASWRLGDYVSMFQAIKSRYTGCCCGVSVSEILRLARTGGRSVGEAVSQLEGAGLAFVAGDGGNALDAVWQEDWAEVHRAAHFLGIPSTAEMVIGEGDSLEERVAGLDLIRAIQEETRGFVAFVLQPRGFESQDVSGVEYLKMLAVSRMYLDHLPHVESGWSKVSLKVCQLGLRFGANDVGSANLVGQSNAEEELRRVIREAGFVPKERDSLFRVYAVN